MRKPFNSLPEVTPDPIFRLLKEAQEAGASGINATAGMILDGSMPRLLDTVRDEAKEWGKAFGPERIGYPPLLGLAPFRSAVASLLSMTDPASIATTGGTGAVALQLRLLKAIDAEIPMLIPTPSWENHFHMCKTVGIETRGVPYLVDGRPSIEPLAEALRVQERTQAVMLQGHCHNPTGLDWSTEQWAELAELMGERETTVVIDMAYQGFGRGVKEDLEPLEILRKSGVPTLVAWSASKNHSLYGLRVGMACVQTEEVAEKERIEQHYAVITRGFHSGASTPGQMIVAGVQQRARDRWEEEIDAVREAMDDDRRALAQALPEEFRPALEGRGMYALLPLTDAQSDRLRREHKVFLGPNARINIGGVAGRIGELAEKIRAVL